MNNKFRITITTLIFISLGTTFSFAQTAQDRNTPSSSPEIYVGMPKDKIYKVYPLRYQIKDYTKDKMEVMVFNDYITPQIGDTITFYLKDGKVEWWDKVQAPQTKQAPDNPKIYAGMSRKEVYEAYPVKYQLQDYVKGAMEIIIFNDYLTADAGDTITFYLKDGKVDWWDKVQANITPEERLRAVLNRAAHAQAGTLPSDAVGADPTISYLKQRDRADSTGSGNVKKYLKGVY